MRLETLSIIIPSEDSMTSFKVSNLQLSKNEGKSLIILYEWPISSDCKSIFYYIIYIYRNNLNLNEKNIKIFPDMCILYKIIHKTLKEYF